MSSSSSPDFDLNETPSSPSLYPTQVVTEDSFVEPAPKKRKRKQDNPKQLSDVDNLNANHVVAKAVSKKLQQIELEKQRLKGVISYVAKSEKKKSMSNVIAEERFQKDLNDPSILKSYSLNAFYFLGASELEVIDVAEFKDYFLQTSDTLLKLEKMEKSLEAYGITSDEFRQLFNKYGKQYFKINERDFLRLKTLKDMLFELKTDAAHKDLKIKAYLIDIVKTSFENKMDGKGMVTCLSPKLRFELTI